ncbi:MAG: hypothetical protein CSB55_03020 [Candidatus Cloacimonadota bacterium]|nr:MAG: hypothetical protein CSB55_03020 [Candidatus Cloacimonadota bacterium]
MELIIYTAILAIIFFLSRKTYKKETNHKIYNYYLYTGLGIFVICFKFLGLVKIGIWLGAVIIAGHTLGVLSKSWDRW